MEHPNPKLETFDSQIPGSLSVPSEPPDLGNWFASYCYESPQMNSNSFRNEICESEREAKSCGFVEIDKKQNSDEYVKYGSSVGTEHVNQCLSKISGSFESASALSEPTDIKHWFSSYVYESPSLDATDGFGKERKCDKDGFLVENNRRENEEDLRKCRKGTVSKENVSENKQLGGPTNCESSWRVTKQARQPAPCPLESPLLLSEPIHIRNWFSSYVYESRSLDANASFGESLFKESKSGKDGFIENSKGHYEDDLRDFSRNRSADEKVVHEKNQSIGVAKCDSSWKNTEHDRQPVSKVPGPLDSSSRFSESTNIRNWFSSYVYESPSLDTADGFGDSVCRDRIDEKDEVLVETRNREKKEGLEGFSKRESNSPEVDVDKEQSEEYHTSRRHNKQEKQPVQPTTGADENLSGENDVCLEYRPKTEKNHVVSQTQQVDTSSFNKADSDSKLEKETFHGTRFKPSNNHRSLCSNDGKCPQNLIRSRGSTLQESSEAPVHAEDNLQLKSDSKLIPINGAWLSKSTHGRKESKEEGKEVSEDGFITTRKRKFTVKNDENSCSKGPPKTSKATVPLLGGKNVVIKRKTLADTTNFHHPPATMITGKWKCPQQRKPNLGPPLRQLGLENWIKKS